ncbi:MAG: hypothetical protein LZF86_250051 [Nitrospira sp.]|nr:MAG: hypothetical protein LZF86_250051 [Nitrospira sp.]
MLALVVVRPAFNVTVPPYNMIGPATLVALPIVRSAVLPLLPSVKPLIVFATVQPESGQVSAEEKLVPNGWTVKAPVVSMALAELVATVSPVRVISLELLVTAVPAFFPRVDPLIMSPPDWPLTSMSPVLASTFVFCSHTP